MSNVKISELGNASSLTGSEEVPIVQSNTTVKTTTQAIADLGGGGLGYLVYVALISQSGTNAPTVDVLFQNTLGGVPVWAYGDVGYYTLTLAGAFPAGKTFCSITQGTQFGILGAGDDTPPNVYSIFNSDSNGSPANGIGSASIEIRVYP